MKKIKIIQIGMGHEHASGKIANLRKLTDVFDVIGVVDESELCSTPRLPSAYEPELYADLKKFTLEEALACSDLNAVTVEVPNNELVPYAMKFAEKGIAIHMDKPAGEDLALYRKLLALCKAKNVPFQMGFMFRGNPAFQFCLRAIREKWIGEVVFMEADMNHCYGGEPYQEYLGKFPGGIMYNLGCHLIDFAVAGMGRPEWVAPFLKSAPGYPDTIKNNCMAVLEYPHAFAVIAACSRTSGNVEARMCRIIGNKGSIEFSPLERFDGGAIEVKLHLREGNDAYPAGMHTLKFPPQRGRYAAQLTELAEIIRGRKQNPDLYEHDALVHEVTLAAAGIIPWNA